MDTYVVTRRDGWSCAADLDQAAARSVAVARDEMVDELRWIRSYVLDEGHGALGTMCIYEATSPEAIRKHATLAGLPVDQIIKVADTVVMADHRTTDHAAEFARDTLTQRVGRAVDGKGI